MWVPGIYSLIRAAQDGFLGWRNRVHCQMTFVPCVFLNLFQAKCILVGPDMVQKWLSVAHETAISCTPDEEVHPLRAGEQPVGAHTLGVQGES